MNQTDVDAINRAKDYVEGNVISHPHSVVQGLLEVIERMREQNVNKRVAVRGRYPTGYTFVSPCDDLGHAMATYRAILAKPNSYADVQIVEQDVSMSSWEPVNIPEEEKPTPDFEWMHPDGRMCIERHSPDLLTVSGWAYVGSRDNWFWCMRKHEDSRTSDPESINWLAWVTSEKDGEWWCPLCGVELHYAVPDIKVLHRNWHVR